MIENATWRLGVDPAMALHFDDRRLASQIGPGEVGWLKVYRPIQRLRSELRGQMATPKKPVLLGGMGGRPLTLLLLRQGTRRADWTVESLGQEVTAALAVGTAFAEALAGRRALRGLHSLPLVRLTEGVNYPDDLRMWLNYSQQRGVLLIHKGPAEDTLPDLAATR